MSFDCKIGAQFNLRAERGLQAKQKLLLFIILTKAFVHRRLQPHLLFWNFAISTQNVEHYKRIRTYLSVRFKVCVFNKFICGRESLMNNLSKNVKNHF